MSSPTATPSESVPLATTKRKFYKLLDNLTASKSSTSVASLHESNHSNTSLPETSAADAPPTKRSRVSDAGMDKQRAVSGNERIRALQEKLFTTPRPDNGPATTERNLPKAGLRSLGPNAPSAKLSTPRKEPNFQPHSQEQFLARLKTFADVKRWTNKPDPINEVQWAKRGWVCDTWNTVACKGGCEQRIAVKLYPKRRDASGNEVEMTEDIPDDGPDEGLIGKLAELIADGHYQDCLWRKRSCDDDIYHIPIPNRAKSSADVLERYRSLKQIADELPVRSNIAYPDPSIADVLKRIPQAFWNPPDSAPETPPSSDPELAAFAFALFGWSGIVESKIAQVTCSHCFQRIGLWLYKDARLEEMSAQLEVPKESLGLNLLEAHRDHCPWKNPVSQHNSKDGPIKDMAGWQTLEFILMSRRKEENANDSRQMRTQSVATAVSEGFDLESYRDSFDSTRDSAITEKKESENLNEKWKKFKAKLKRTTSRKSLRSVKSAKSSKSTKTVGEKDKENESARS